MFKKLKRAYSAAPIATLIFAISLVLALGFAGRMVVDAIDGPPPKDTQIEQWMTPKYISRTWKVPPEIMREFLDVQKSDDRRHNLQQIADLRGIAIEDLIAELKSDIDQFIEDRKSKRDRK